MDCVDDVFDCEPVFDSKGSFVDHVSRQLRQDVDSQYAMSLVIDDHLDQSPCLAGDHGFGNVFHEYGPAATLVASLKDFLLGEPHRGNLGRGEDSSWHS